MSDANFIAEGKTLQTKYRPVIRFNGKHTASALYGFLEMNRVSKKGADEGQKESAFSVYIRNHVRCSKCGSPMAYKVSKNNKPYLRCSKYPTCNTSGLVEQVYVDAFIADNDVRCPEDRSRMKSSIGKNGVYIKCPTCRKAYTLDEV